MLCPTLSYDLTGKVAVLTGGAGALCSAMARGLVACKAKVGDGSLNCDMPEIFVG
jgi:NAD(P)-dependent dehydrogenase (short-subunit alcohol dehydrogenase family)